MTEQSNSGHPEKIFLLGHPVSHSLSPVFQNAAIRAAGLRAVYEARDVLPADLERVVSEIHSVRGAGNVTIPHKAQMPSLCNVVSPVVNRTGAVNSFRVVDGSLHGDNTDVEGFTLAVRALLGRDPVNEHVALIGAGGAASAVLAAIESWPASTATVQNRNVERLRALVDRFATIARAAKSMRDLIADATIVVNATSVGLRDDATPLDVADLPRDVYVLDLVYRPGDTRFVRDARARGNRAADGREMLLEQGALAFTQWFDVVPDKMVMREALDRAMLGG